MKFRTPAVRNQKRFSLPIFRVLALIRERRRGSRILSEAKDLETFGYPSVVWKPTDIHRNSNGSQLEFKTIQEFQQTSGGHPKPIGYPLDIGRLSDSLADEGIMKRRRR
jgi:hypothetical protein